jgi:hypothetical protein
LPNVSWQWRTFLATFNRHNAGSAWGDPQGP